MREVDPCARTRTVSCSRSGNPDPGPESGAVHVRAQGVPTSLPIRSGEEPEHPADKKSPRLSEPGAAIHSYIWFV